MAGLDADVSTGLTLLLGTTGFTANVLSANWTGGAREPKATSHMSTAQPSAGEVGNMTFLPGDLVDPGQLDITFQFKTNEQPPMSAVAELVTLTWALGAGDAVAASLAGQGFFISFEITADLDEIMEATASIKFTGPLTWTDSTT